MKKSKHKFKSEIHLGLLVIIVALLFLNFVSNFIIYNARSTNREKTVHYLNNTALAIKRNIGNELTPQFSGEYIDELKNIYSLSSIILIPSTPVDNSIENRRHWFLSIIRNLPPGQVPDIADRIISSDFKTLTRGKNNEYFYVFPIESVSGKKLLVLSTNNKDLAYLDDASKFVLIISIIVILSLTVVYFWFFRFILSPFKKLKKEAIKAGRELSTGDDEVEQIVAEYQNIINELKLKETELTILNEAIKRKADSLEQFNRYLVNSMVSGIITFDNDGNILSLNDSASAMLKTTETILIGKNIDEMEFFNSAIKKAVNKTLSDNFSHGYKEYQLRINSEETLTAGVTIFSVYDNKTNKIGASVLMNDLTELKQLRRELEQKNRLAALGEMAAGLAHQLRNSLGAIMGFNTLVKKRLLKNNLDAGPASIIENEIKEAESLVERFLSFAKPLDVNAEKTDLIELVNDIINNIKIRNKNISIKANLEVPDNLEIQLDSLLIKQALSNIIENAANAYENEAGEININLFYDNLSVTIEIIDQASGIAEENIENIFTPFYSTKPSGNGLGLPLAKKIIDIHQGRLIVNSSVGLGTKFTVILPREHSKKVLIS